VELWRQLLQEQQSSNFSELAGAQASLLLPVSDRLVSRLLLERAPPEWAVTITDVRADPGDQVVVSVRLKKAAFLPFVRIRFAIERQPALPESPVLVLKLAPDLVTTVAGRFLNRLPPGVTFDGQRVTIDLSVVLARFQATETLLRYLSDASITTRAGIFVLSARFGPLGVTSG